MSFSDNVPGGSSFTIIDGDGDALDGNFFAGSRSLVITIGTEVVDISPEDLIAMLEFMQARMNKSS